MGIWQLRVTEYKVLQAIFQLLGTMLLSSTLHHNHHLHQLDPSVSKLLLEWSLAKGNIHHMIKGFDVLWKQQSKYQVYLIAGSWGKNTQKKVHVHIDGGKNKKALFSS